MFEASRLRQRGMTVAAILLVLAPLPNAPVLAAPPKFTDTCDSLRKPFREIRDYQMGRIIGGAVTGLLAGLATALLVDAVNGKGQGVDYGAAAAGGAVTGGLVGYITSKQQAGMKRDELRAAIDGDFRQDVDQFSPLPGNLIALGDCRRQQIYQVQVDGEAGTIDKREAAKRLTKVESWITADDKLIARAAGQQSKTVTSFAQATAMADGIDPETAQSGTYALNRYGNATAAQDEFDVQVSSADLATPAPAQSAATTPRGVRRVVLRPAKRRAGAAPTRVGTAIGGVSTFAKARERNKVATLEQMRAARSALQI